MATSPTHDQLRTLLSERGMRVTAPRLMVLRVLAESAHPLSHSEVLERIGSSDCDPATIYRNLVKLRDAGLAPMVTAEGIDRYSFGGGAQRDHRHPHFVCEDCGKVACLPIDLARALPVEGAWEPSVRGAMVQLRGECPDCLSGDKGGAEPTGREQG